MRFFNTGGPCNPKLHYTVTTNRFVDNANVRQLIQRGSYFVIHAPRQVGKTTAMLSLAKELTASGDYVAVLLSLEAGNPFSQETMTAEQAIITVWKEAVQKQLPTALHPPQFDETMVEGSIIHTYLSQWASASPLPLVIFLDEIDALEDETLISVLRQLRSGYPNRPNGFPHSLALIGLRDVRDYKVRDRQKGRLVSGSPFNIAVRSITIRNFTFEETADLVGQHTAETSQLFEPAAIERLHYLTDGQPWLVNALAGVCVDELEMDVGRPITADHINTAKEIIIRRRQTHLDSLADKLREPRVKTIVLALLEGESPETMPRDDIDYVLDLGLVVQQNGSGLQVANPIYQEIIPRELSSISQAFLPHIQPSWLNRDGTLNAEQLLSAFLAFWRQHGQPLLKTAPYHEIAPHLVLMAFLHRVVNGGGTLDREYAIGTRRLDLCLHYGDVRVAMELKTWRDDRPDPLADGLAQLDHYLDGLGLETGWLVIFDQRSGQPDIAERTTAASATTPSGRTITLIRG